jgi:hydrogenase expression/formation protein HypC
MCLAIPGKIVAVHGTDSPFRVAQTDFAGVRKEVSLSFTPEATVGDYVLVHVGFALTVISREEAEKTLDFLQTLASEEELRIELESRDV